MIIELISLEYGPTLVVEKLSCRKECGGGSQQHLLEIDEKF